MSMSLDKYTVRTRGFREGPGSRLHVHHGGRMEYNVSFVPRAQMPP